MSCDNTFPASKQNSTLQALLHSLLPAPPIVNNNVILRVAKGKGGIVVHMMFIANLIKIFKYKFVAFLFGAAGWGLHARRQTSNGGSARKKT